MKWLPSILLFVSLALNALLAFVNWATKARPEGHARWLGELVATVQPNAYGLIFAIAIVAAAVQAIEKIPRTAGFRKKAVRRCLDQIVSGMCEGRAKQNRLSLFRKAPGWQVWLIAHWRLWMRPGDTQRKREALKQIKFREEYLYVWARSSDARNARSSAAFRASDNENHCEGFAGLVWEKGFHRVGNLPAFEEGELRNISDIQSHSRAADIQQYMSKTNIKTLEQLRSIEHYARHFMGAKLRVGEQDWGVLLMDSEQSNCPFDLRKQKGGEFGSQFENHAKVLARIVS